METTIQFTRKQYLNKECTHAQYYGQFVTEDIKSLVRIQFGIDKLKAEYESDPNLNSIPLAKWDLMQRFIGRAPYQLKVPMSLVGDYLTIAGIVCIAKEAARQVIQ